jgi:RHS repeat-associated protein
MKTSFSSRRSRRHEFFARQLPEYRCDCPGARLLRFESLEQRRLLSVVHWTGGPLGTGTNLEDATNWENGLLPRPTDDAVIDNKFASQTIASAANLTVNSLTCDAALQLTGGTLTVPATVKVNNTFSIVGGALAGATVQAGSLGQGLICTSSGGTLDGVILQSGLDLASNPGAYLHVLDGLTLNGTATLGYQARMYFDNTEILGGTGTVVFNDAQYQGLIPNAYAMTLTIAAGITVRGGNHWGDTTSGSVIGYSSWAGGGGYVQIVNLGTISADTSGTSIIINPSGSFWNQGTLSASGGGLTLNGISYNESNINANSGGTLTLNGSWTNGAAPLNSVKVAVYSGFQHGGSGAPFSNLVGTFTANSISFGASQNNFNWHPFGLAGFGADITATVLVAADGTYNFPLTSDDGSALLIDGNEVVNDGNDHGPATVSAPVPLTAGTHTLEVQFYENGAGTSGVELPLPVGVSYQSNTLSTPGTITATNATVNLGGSFSTTDLGTFNRTGGTVNLIGTVSNAGQTLAIGGPVNLLGGTIQGGTVDALGGAQLALTASGGLLNTVTVDGALDLTASSAYATVTGGLTLNGTATLGYAARLYFNGTQALGGAGAVVFNNAQYQGLIANANNMTLTIGAGIAILGGNNWGDTYNGSVIGYSRYWSGGSNVSIFNLGLIGANAWGTTLVVNPTGSFTNQGTASASNGGTLDLDGAWTSAGTVRAAGGTLNLGDQSNSSGIAWSNTGTIAASNSTVNLGGSFSSVDLATFADPGGTVNLVGTMVNAGGAQWSIAGSHWNLAGGTIVGGTLNESADAMLAATSSGGTLTGVTINGPLDLTAGSARLAVTGGLTLNGTSTLGPGAAIYFNGSQTLGGTGTFVFNNAQYQGLIANTNNMTLTIGAGITVRGGNSWSDTYNGSVIGYSSYFGGGNNVQIVNLGTISADTLGTAIVLDPNGGFVNQGTLSATNAGTLNLAGTFTTASLGTIGAGGGTLSLTGTLNNAGSTLALNGSTGSLNLAGGTINGGTVAVSAGAELVLTSSGGRLSGVTVSGPLDLTAISAYATVTKGLTLNGTATLGYQARLYFNDGSQTLGGTGTVVFANTQYEALVANANNMTLTIGAGITIRGGSSWGDASNGPVIGYSGCWSGGSNASIINLGTISADTWGTAIVVNPSGTLTNQGALSAANGGTLNLNGTVAQLGSFNGLGGTVNCTGTVENDGSTLALTPATGSLVLSGTILGGTVSEAGGAELISAGGTLDGVTLNGPLDLTAANSRLSIVDGLTLNGTATLGSYARIYFNGSQTLGGLGTVNFGNAAYQGLIANFNNMTLTIGAGVTIHGGNNQGYNTYSGSVIGYSNQFGGGSNTSIVNLGTISADTFGTSIIVNPGTFTNRAALSAANGGTLYLGGLVTQLGTFNSSGGTMNVTGTLENDGSTLALTAATGSLVVSGAVAGGTVSEAGGAELLLAGGTLDAVTINGPLDLTAGGAYAVITDGLTLNGIATLGAYARLYFNGSQTLGGTGTVDFSNANYQGLIANANNMTLTIGAGITIRGGNNQGNNTSSGSVIGYSSWASGGSNASVVNLGTISADTLGMSIIVNPSGTFSNQGRLSAVNGGTLDLNGTWTSAGSITATGGTLNFGGTWSNTGTIGSSGGILNLTGTLNNAGSTLALSGSSGSLNVVGGVINGGTVTASGGAELVIAGSSTLNALTLNGPLDLTANYAYAVVTEGLTLNGTASLGYQGRLYFNGTQTLGGTGTVIFNNAQYQGLIANASYMTLTIGSGITIRGGNGWSNDPYSGSVIGYSTWVGGGGGTSIVNLGTIVADTAGTSIVINPNGTFTNQGTLSAANGGTLYLNGLWTNAGAITTASGTMNLGGTWSNTGTIHSGGGTVNLTGTLNNTGSTLTLNAGSGPMNLAGGIIIGGAVAESDGAELVMTGSGGTLNGVTINGPLDLMAGGAYATVTNGLTLNGTATLGGQARLYFNGTQTLGGTGTVFFANAQYQGLIANANNMTLTIGPGITVRGGNQWTDTSYGSVIGYSSWAGGGSNAQIVNLGTISADKSGMSVIVNATGSLTNQGVLSADKGGLLYLGGTVAQLGTFNSNGGMVNVTGMLQNSGSTLALTAATGSLTVSGTVVGGTVSEAGGAELISANGTLDGVTLNGPLDLTAANARVSVTEGLTLNGTATLGFNSAIFFSGGSQTLGGTGTVVFNNAQYQGLIANANNMTLTIGAGITIRGGNNQGNNTSYGSAIGYSNQFGGGNNAQIVNLGTITADTAGVSIIVNPSGAFTNAGTLSAANGGTLYLNGYGTSTGTLATANGTLSLGGTWFNFGEITSNGGTLNLTGTLNNAGNTLALSGATGSLYLVGGTINGGTVTASGGAKVVLSSNGGALDGVTISGPLDLTAANANAAVSNGLTLNGTATIGYNARLYFNGSQTLGGSGTVFFTNAPYQGLIANISNMTLSIGAGITISGGNNQGNNVSSGSVIGYSSQWGGGANASIVNRGTIAANTPGMSIVVNSTGVFTNQGMIADGNGGSLAISGTLINSGTIYPSGSGPTGTIAVSGDFRQLPGGTLNVDIGGTTAGPEFNRLVVAGSAVLDGTIALSLINGYQPVAGATIPFLTYGSHSGGFAAVSDANPGDAIGYGASGTALTLGLPPSAPPQVTAVSPPDGAFRAQGLSAVEISFSKALDPATLISTNFTLQDGNGNSYVPASVQPGNNNRQVQLDFSSLPGGSYTLTLNAPAIKDPGGLDLGTQNYASHFTLGNVTATFINPAGGDWNNPSNWQNGRLPGPNDNVVIDTGNTSATVTFSSGSATVNSLTSLDPFTLSGGTLTVTGNVQVNNTFTLAGGTLAKATVLAGTGGQSLTCTQSGGTLTGVTLNGALDVTASWSNLAVVDGLTLNGTATLGYGGRLYFNGSQMLGGSGTVVFNNTQYQGLIAAADNMTLTIGAGIRVRGGNQWWGDPYSGSVIGYSTWARGGNSASIVNLGTIAADTSGVSILVNPTGTFTNNAALSASNGGGLYVSGVWTSAGTIATGGGTIYLGGVWTNTGTISSTGGAFNLTGTLNNAGSVLTLGGSGGSFNVAGGTINGGTVTEIASVTLAATSSGGTLKAVTVNGPLDLTASSANLAVVDGLTLNGTATLGYGGRLYFVGSQTLGGSGTVVFNNAQYQGLITAANNMTLTIASGITVRGGNQWWGDAYSGSVIGYSTWAGGGSNAQIVNLGTIAADTSGVSIFVNPTGTLTNQGTLSTSNSGGLYVSGTWTSAGTIAVGNGTMILGGIWTNTGTISASGGTVNMGGTWSNTGTINSSGGTLNLTGTLNNAGSTLTLNAASGSLNLAGGTINGGIVAESGGAELVATGSGGTLNGVTIDGPLNVTASYSYAAVTNGLTLNGAATLGYQSRLYFNGSQTLGGNGTAIFNNAQYQGLIANTNNMTLTIGAGITIRGGNQWRDTYSGSVIGYSSWAGGGSNTSIVNLGTITADTSGFSIFGNPAGTLTNQGSISAANGGTLYLGGVITQLGTFNSNGGTVNVIGILPNGGSTLALTAATGSLTVGGMIQGGTINASGGSGLIAANGTLDGLTLNGPLDVTASNTYAVVTNGLTLNGTATLGYQARIYFNGTQTLGGTGTVFFNNAQYQGLIANTNSMTLTIGPGITVRGGNQWWGDPYSGSVIGYSTWLGGGSNTSIVNLGTIGADTSGLSIDVNPNGSLTNLGTLSASNSGGLYVNGAWTNAAAISAAGGPIYLGGTWTNSGTIKSTGGTLNLNGILNNTGSTLALNATSGSLNLLGGIIQGGTVNASGGAELVATGNGGTLSGVTLNGPLDLTANYANLAVTGGLTLNGTASLGYQSRLYFNGTQTLGGTGTVVFNNAQYQGLIANANNMTLTIGAGVTIRAGNQWRDTYSGSVIGYSSWAGGGSNTSIVNLGTITADMSGFSIFVNPTGTLTNQGTVSAANGGTLYLGGVISQLGTFNSNGGTVNITGTLPNGGSTLALTAATGSLTVGGTIQGGTVNASGSAELIPANGTLDGVTLNGPLDLTAGNTYAVVNNGLTLNGTAMLGYQARIYFNGTQTLGGTGTVIFNNAAYQGLIASANNMTLTIGAGITIRGGNNQGANTYSGSVIGYSNNWGGGSNAQIVNLGTINADTPTMSILVNPTGSFTDRGAIEATGGMLFISSSMAINKTGDIISNPTAAITVSGNLLGNTTNVSSCNPQGMLTLNGSGTAGVPQLLEAMSQDLGNVSAGWTNNCGYGELVLANSTYVELVDQSHNSSGSGPDAVYAQSVIVPPGSTLDLNNLHLYARAMQIAGTLLNGSISQIPNAGALVLAMPTPGNISMVGQLDEWTFFDNGGRTVSILVNPGTSGAPTPVSPQLQWVNVQLLDSNNKVLGSADNTSAGAVISLNNIVLPVDGTYKIHVSAPAGQPVSTGNYLVSAYDVTPTVRSLNINKMSIGTIRAPFALDQWNFSETAGQQVQFNLIGTTSSSLAFTLTGPGGYTAFSDLTTSSPLINLPASGNYTLSAYGQNGVVGSYSFQINQTTVTALPLGTIYHGTLSGPGEPQLFKVTVTNAGPLTVSFADASTTNLEDIYIGQGTPPTRETFNYASTQSHAAQSVLVPFAAPGTWYVLVYSDWLAAATTFTLQAASNVVVLESLTPGSYSANQTAVLTISGAGFVPGTQVALVAGGNTYLAHSVTVNSFAQLTAQFDLTSVPVGTYDVKVTLPGGNSAALSAAFQVLPAGQAELVTNLILPSALGRHAIATLYIQYSNVGTVAMPAPMLTLQSADPVQKPLLTLNPSLLSTGLWTSAIPDGFNNVIQVYASGATPGLLEPGESVQIPVYYVGLQQPWDFSRTTLPFQLTVHDAGDSTTIDWNSLKSPLQPTWISANAWNAVFANLVSLIGPTWGDYVQMLSNNATYLSRLGENDNNVSDLYYFAFQQAMGITTLPTLASGTDASLPTPGLPLAFTRVFDNSILARNSVGPFGAGWSTPWQISLQVQSDGTVRVSPAPDQQRFFQPDTRHTGTYFSQPGDSGVLTKLSDTSYLLTESSGQVTAFYPSGTLNYVQDTNGNRITAGYTSGRLISLIHSCGASLTIAYNAAGLISRVTDSAGRVASYAYDPTNTYLVSATTTAGNITYTYDTGSGAATANDLLSVGNPSGVTSYFNYDIHGRLTDTYLTGNVQHVTYSYNLGEVIATDASTAATKTFFDYRGAVVRSEDALGNYVLAAYNSARQLVRITDSLGGSISYTRDVGGRPMTITDQLGQTTTFTRTGPYHLTTSLTDADGNVTSYTYNAAFDLTSIAYADGSVVKAAYNGIGVPTATTNARGQITTYLYNAAGQVTQETFADGSQAMFSYDSFGNLISTADATGTTTYTYNAANQITSVAYPSGETLTYAYDAGRRLAQLVDATSGFTVNYHYDAAGRPQTLTDGSGATLVTYKYDVVGRLAEEDNANGTYATYQYDAAGNLLHLINFGPGSVIQSRFDYAYNGLGERTSETTLGGTWTYSYDVTGQLTHAVFASTGAIPNQDLTYVYDAVGNRIQTIANGVAVTYTANNRNQYTSVGGMTYKYDADGNLISQTDPSGTTTFTYNSVNELTGMATATDTWAYQYNARGQRVSAIHNGQKITYVLDPAGFGSVVAAYDSSGHLVADYAYGYGLALQSGPTAANYYQFNGIGSAVGLTNSTGNVVNSYTYDPFGNVLASTQAVANPFQFIGGLGVLSDGNALDSMRAREYAPGLGRFLSRDPIGQGVVLYAYAGNNPVTIVDPSGEGFYFGAFHNGGPNNFLGASFGASSGASVGGSAGGSAGASAGASAGGSVGASAGASVGGAAGGSVGASVGGNAGAGTTTPGVSPVQVGAFGGADAGASAGASVGASGGASVGASGGASVGASGGASYGASAGASTGYSQGSSSGWGIGFGWDPPTPPGGGGGGGGSSNVPNVVDPNDIIGPAGYGPENFMAEGKLLPYHVDFENEPSATAPVQRVVVTQQLSADLDWSTFDFVDFGFGLGDTFVSASGHYFHASVQETHNGTPFVVDIEGELDLGTGLVTVTFQALDPATSLPPGVLTGFLPPENGTGIGKGYFDYTVRAKLGLATGTAFSAVALVSFDQQANIATNQVDDHDPSKGVDPAKMATVTIDAGPPTSTVTPLPATEPTLSFPVSWTGHDDAGGSGIASYSIFVSDNGGPFALWQSATAKTTATYAGQANHTYGFYSVANDNVGNIEPTPSAAEAITTVQVQPALIVTPAIWTSAGLTLTLGSDGNLHVYVTGTSTDAVPPVAPASVSKIEITAPSSGSANLTVDSTTGNPLPAGGLTYGGAGGLIKTGLGSVSLSNTNTYTGSTMVSSGTLLVTRWSALLDGSSLTIGSSSAFAAAPASSGTAIVVVGASAASLAAVPELWTARQATPAADLTVKLVSQGQVARAAVADWAIRDWARDQGSARTSLAGLSVRSQENGSAASGWDAVLCANQSVRPSLGAALIWDVINAQSARGRSGPQPRSIDKLLAMDGTNRSQ